MWNVDNCLIALYLISFLPLESTEPTKNSTDTGKASNDTSPVEGIMLIDGQKQDDLKAKLEAIFSKTPEEFADEIIQFARSEGLIDGDETHISYEIDELFWLSKGLDIDRIRLPQNYRFIRKKAWLIATLKLKNRQPQEPFKPILDSFTRHSPEGEKTILLLSNEELAEELLTFARKTGLAQNEMLLSREIVDMFWEFKGIKISFDTPLEISIKTKQVEKLAQEIIYQKIFLVPIDVLAKELANYARKQSGREDGQGVYIASYRHLFWKSRGLDFRSDISIEIQQKMIEVERLAQEIIDEDFYEYRKKRILSEKDELPKLVQLCLDWARSSGRRSITVKDVEYFLHEINVHILEPTERELYLLVNNEMKN